MGDKIRLVPLLCQKRRTILRHSIQNGATRNRRYLKAVFTLTLKYLSLF